MTRLSENKVLALFGKHPYLSTSLLVNKFDVDMQTASKYLIRLAERNIVEKEPGDGNQNWYFPIIPDININARNIIMKVIRSWQKKEHKYLRVIPKSKGGSLEGGGGQYPVLREFVKELVELNLIHE